MLSFYDWLVAQESSPESRALNAPWAYPAMYVGGNPNSERTATPRQLKNWEKMVKRDTKKKKHKKKLDEGKARADRSFDGTVKEIELLKSDLKKLADKKGEKKPEKKATNQKAPGIQDLLDIAKIALTNLRTSPDYYEKQSKGLVRRSTTGKVSVADAQRAARELGVDFRNSKFNGEVFRKAIESEFNRLPAVDVDKNRGDDLE